MEDTKYEALMETGKSAAASIQEMVDALECDYGRLEELKSERASLVDNMGLVWGGTSAEPKPDKANKEALAAVVAWDEDYATELAELTVAAGECESREYAETRIHEDALSVEVRSGWVSIGDIGGGDNSAMAP